MKFPNWIIIYITTVLAIASCAELSPDEAREKLEDENIPVNEDALIANVQTNDTEIVEWLLAAGVDPNSEDGRGVSALIWAADLGYPQIVELLIEYDARVDSRESGVSPLMIAAMEGHEQIVQMLIEAGASVNLQNQDGMTALMSAAFNGHENIVKLLLENGADPHLEMSSGIRAHQLASDRGYDELATYIRNQAER